MAELADALVLGTSGYPVQVRPLLLAPFGSTDSYCCCLYCRFFVWLLMGRLLRFLKILLTLL